jgi:hypothetical protein
MRIPQSYIQKCKVVAHVFQAIFVFIAACLTIAVMTKDGDIGGATRYFFAMVSDILSCALCVRRRLEDRSIAAAWRRLTEDWL